MNIAGTDAKLILAGAVVAVAGAVYLRANWKPAGMAIGRGAVEAVDGVLAGVVTGVGEVVGVPQTNLNECERAIAEGRTMDASFACPAGRFMEYLLMGK